MAVHLTKAVLAGGRAFLAGTARQGVAAQVIPDGPWWSTEEPAQSPTPAREAVEPPRSGRGSGVTAWRAYADGIGVAYAADATRDEIITAIDKG